MRHHPGKRPLPDAQQRAALRDRRSSPHGTHERRVLGVVEGCEVGRGAGVAVGGEDEGQGGGGVGGEGEREEGGEGGGVTEEFLVGEVAFEA